MAQGISFGGPVRAGLMMTTSLMSLALCALPAQAQTATPGPAPITSTPPAQPGAAGTDTTPQDGIAENADGDAQQGDQALSDIVVTGTLLRGIAPTGTNVVGVSRDAIVTTGVASSNDLLARIPQITNSFNQLPTPTSDAALPINRPNIRNLGASGGSTTLVLINGRRVVGQGILQTSVDPSIIPPGILDRVDVIPDGGSSIYGSDAIGGVINFITRKRFDGVEGAARYGIADDYRTFDATLTAGRDWGTGSLVLSYAYAEHDDLLGRDRDFITQNHLAQGSTDQRSTNCSPGTVTAGGVAYALPNFTPGTNRCDEAQAIDFYPREHRHSVFGSLTQDLTDRLTFNMTAYWAQRVTETLGFGATNGTGVRGSGTITSANPYFRPVGTATSQTVAFSLADVATGRSGKSLARLESYGVTPGFDIKVGGDWQVRASANVGRSFTLVEGDRMDGGALAAALAGTTTATALNPYNPGASNPAVLAGIFNYRDYGRAIQELAEGRVVADGTLLNLPGGSVRLAVGGEYHYEDLSVVTKLGRIGTSDGFARGISDRSVRSVFGELFVPVFGAGNGFAGLRSLDLSASVRYDDYNDVGGTTNPKFGFNYRPFDSLKIRGNWGTSFHAPSLSDLGTSVDSRVQILVGRSPFRAGNALPTDSTRTTILLAGGNPNLKPETAHTWSAGADFTPEFVGGLTLSGTYWNVDFKNSITVPPFFTGPSFYANPGYAGLYTLSPTLAQLQAAAGTLRLDGAASLGSLYANGATPYVLINARRNNLNVVKTDGIDFNAVFAGNASFGSYNASVGGSYVLNRKTAAVAGAAFADDLRNGIGRLSLVGSAGAKVGPVNAQVTVNYSDGYPILGDATQRDVADYTTTNVFLSLDLPSTGVLRDAAITLNVDNVFDVDPPYRNDFDGVAFTTVGRIFTIGLRKKF